MKPSLRRYLVSLRNSFHHPGVTVASGSSLNALAQIDRTVSIGRDCVVLDAQVGGQSKLGDRVVVSSGAALYGCEVDSDCRVEAGAQLAGSRLGSGVAVHKEAELCGVKIGRFSYVARQALLNEVDVGQFCSIGPRCLIGSGDHPVQWVATSPVFYSGLKQAGRSLTDSLTVPDVFDERRRITIGHDVWIGAQVFVRDGLCIANGAVVAAGAVVVRDVPAYAVVGGVPARIIRFRFSPEIVEIMQATAWWNWSDELLREARPLISSPNIEAFMTFARNRGAN